MGSAIYELTEWRMPFQELSDAEVDVKYAREEFPPVDGNPTGHVIAKCWTEGFKTANDVFNELRLCLSCYKAQNCVSSYSLSSPRFHPEKQPEKGETKPFMCSRRFDLKLVQSKRQTNSGGFTVLQDGVQVGHATPDRELPMRPPSLSNFKFGQLSPASSRTDIPIVL